MRRAQSGSRKPGSPIKNVVDDGVGNTHSNIQNICRPRIRISLRWARRRLRPESASRRRLFERSEFLSHLIRGGGGGIPESLLLSRLGGTAHGQKIDIGRRSPAFPVTPPYVRVRIRRFGGLSYQRTVNRGIPSESK